jgi:hypothetical protein
MSFATKKILKDSTDWLMSKTLLPRSYPSILWDFISSGGGKFVSSAFRTNDSLYSEKLNNLNFSKILDENGYWKSIAYGRGIFAAVSGVAGEYAHSNDGITWNTTTSGLHKNSVAYGKGIFVAVGALSTASYSNDGINWTEVLIPNATFQGITFSSITFTSIAYGNGTFVAVSPVTTLYNGVRYSVVAVSTNGTSWNSYVINTGQEKWVSQSIAYGNGLFVAAPTLAAGTTGFSRRTFLSFDGITWGRSMLNLPLPEAAYKITYGAGYFCIVNITSKRDFYFGDGNLWYRSIMKRDQEAFGVGYGYGKFAIIGGNRVSYTSSNRLPALFSSANLPISSNWNCHAYGKGIHIFISSSLGNAVYATSRYGYSWEQATIQTRAWNDVKYGGGIFVAVSSDVNGISYSSDGITWTPVTRTASSRLSITYGRGNFVCVGNSTQLLYSSNGSSWTAVTLSSSGWNGVAYGLGKFVAVKNGTNFIYSSNMSSWTTITVPSGNWGKIKYGNGVFVALSETESNQFIYSKDGINWSLGNLTGNLTILAFTYGGGIFLAIPSNNDAIFSYDGINWSRGIKYNYLSGDSNIKTLGYGHGSFFAPVFGTNRILSVYQQIFRQTNVSNSNNF